MTGSVKEQRTVDAAYMDLSKPLVAVSHSILAAKLGSYGVDAAQYERSVRNWLNCPAQRITNSGLKCTWCQVMRSTPQKTILGSMLFSIFIMMWRTEQNILSKREGKYAIDRGSC